MTVYREGGSRSSLKYYVIHTQVGSGSDQRATSNGTDQDPNISNFSYPDLCMDEEYTGSACRSQLARLQQCLHVNDTNDSAINIAHFGNQEMQEKLASGLNFGVSYLKSSGKLSAGCEELLEPFSCLYLFPLETCNEEGRAKTYRPSRQTCESIRDQVCAEEWKFAEGFAEGFNIELPVCSNLNDTASVNLLEMCQGW